MSINFRSSGISAERMSTRRILVAGGAGFLGSHLCERLLNEGNFVICVDNFSTGRLENLRNLLRYDTFSFVRHDIVNPIDLPVDEIYNLACPASPPHYQADPVHTMKTSVIGSLNLLELAAHYQARIFQASTSEVYGDPQTHPQPEAYWGNVNSFGPGPAMMKASAPPKRCSTIFTSSMASISVSCASSIPMAARPDDGRVVSNFIVQALKREDITIYGDGSQTRSFCYVDDLIEGFSRLMNSQVQKPVNIGNPGEFTVRELAEQIIALTNSSSRIVYRPLPTDDPRQRRRTSCSPSASLAGSRKLRWPKD